MKGVPMKYKDKQPCDLAICLKVVPSLVAFDDEFSLFPDYIQAASLVSKDNPVSSLPDDATKEEQGEEEETAAIPAEVNDEEEDEEEEEEEEEDEEQGEEAEVGEKHKESKSE